MDVAPDVLQALVDRPRESLATEYKNWIDPDSPDGQAKIVRGTLALRNHGGGFLIIGFKNDPLEPDTAGCSQEVRTRFHGDRLQGLVGRFASELFEIAVFFPERNGQEYPVIAVPSGIKTPIAAKSDLISADGARLVATDDVYVRSLRTNNTPSTTKIGWKDWQSIVQVCFENREADFVQLLRRNLGGRDLQLMATRLADAAGELVSGGVRSTTKTELAEFLRQSREKLQAVASSRNVPLPNIGSWEVALVIRGDVPPHQANRSFLRLLDSSNPRFTGWPVWLDSEAFTEQAHHPYVVDGMWEAFISGLNESTWSHFDFMRLSPAGRFYLFRFLDDDLMRSSRSPKPLSELDFGLAIVRTAESMAVGISYAKAMGCIDEKTELAFGFRWAKLRNRRLTSWAEPMRFLSTAGVAEQDEITTSVVVPLATPLAALGDYVKMAILELFQLFGGFEIGQSVVDELTQNILNRRR